MVRPLLAPEGDVLVAGCSSGLTVAHTASLLGPRHTPRGSKSRVSVCVGERPPEQREELQETLANVGCKSTWDTSVLASAKCVCVRLCVCVCL